PKIDQSTNPNHRREHGGQNTDHVYHRKTTDGTGTEGQRSNTHNQTRQVGVKNSGRGTIKDQVNRSWRWGPMAYFLSDTLVDQHVGVNGHTQRQRNGRNTRQGQGCLQHGQHGQQQEHVEGQANGREQTNQVVIQHDEDRNRNKAVQRGVKALANIVGTEARTYGAFFNNAHGGGQRAGTEQQGDIGGFLSIHAAADLYLVVRNFAADNRSRHHFTHAIFKQHNGHALVDVVAGNVAENPRALVIQCQVDGGLLGLRISAGLGVLQVFTRQDDLTTQQQGGAATFGVALQTKGHGARIQRGNSSRGVLHHTQFQRGGTTQNFLGLGYILHTGQLHHDAVGTLLLNHRFGHAQLVDTVVQSGDVLLECVGLHL